MPSGRFGGSRDGGREGPPVRDEMGRRRGMEVTQINPCCEILHTLIGGTNSDVI